MKKAINLVFAVLATLAVVSCGGTVEVPDTPEEKPVNPTPDPGPDEPDDSFGGDVVFQATMESLSSGIQPVWKKGESISVFDGTSTVKATNTAEDGVVGQFPATIKKGTESVFALSPSNDGVQLNSTGVLLDIPAVQNLASPVPAYKVAKSKSDILYFRNVVAVLNLSVAVDGVTSVVIQADDAAKIAGTVSIDYSGDSPAVAASSSRIEVKGEFRKGEVYSVVLAPAVLTKCSVEAYVGENSVAKSDLDGKVLQSGTVLELPALAPSNPIYKITHMWVWGGTGNTEYDFTKVNDLFSLPELFNNEDGRGIDALKDNYLVFNADGTFRNWAGADGRNWWFVYSGSKNPKTHIDLDLKGFYDLLPRSTATYTEEDGVITFTKPDGSTVKADLLPAGDYAMPNTNPEKVVSITKEALRFDITGGTESWKDSDHIYDEYWRVAGYPRQLFMEIERMPASFTVPSESRTTDADFKFNAPVYDFDLNSLPGTWNVLGSGTGKPWGLWVNGGSGSTAAFVSPIEKLWCWGPKTSESSVCRDTDNTLTIAITGWTGTTVTGTIKWEAGDDGEFWDCIWKKKIDGTDDPADSHFGEDLSKYFSHIPKGVLCNVVVDLATGAGKINDEIDFTFVTAGIREFSNGQLLEIPNECFALAFHNMNKIDLIEGDKWSDVDRFVNAPLDYVIIFKK